MNINGIVDDKLIQIRHQMLDTGKDPYPLPSSSDDFQITLFNHTLNASVWLGDGAVLGISRVHRTADCIANFSSFYPLSLNVSGSAGLTAPHVSYHAGVKLGPLAETVGVEFQIPLIDLKFSAHTNGKLNGTTLHYCEIDHFTDPRVDLSGVGLIDTPVFNMVLNAAMGFFHNVLQAEVSKIGCEVIQKLIHHSSIDLLRHFEDELFIIK